jgi:hypothetical protein
MFRETIHIIYFLLETNLASRLILQLHFLDGHFILNCSAHAFSWVVLVVRNVAVFRIRIKLRNI